MGADVEKDKIRPIYDATISAQLYNTTHWKGAWHLALQIRYMESSGAIAIGWRYHNDDALKRSLSQRRTKAQQGKHHPQLLTLFKSGASKARRRCMAKEKELEYQIPNLGDNCWINKVGTYGVASARAHRGRLAAAIILLLCHLFPAINWMMDCVGDIVTIMDEPLRDHLQLPYCQYYVR